MSEAFQQGSPVERWLNRAFGFLVSRGIAPGYCYELEVRGRKSGKIYTTPVNVLEHGGKRWLVAPRGRTQWTRNAEAVGEVNLHKGRYRQVYAVRMTALDERPELLKRYLETWPSQVARFFKVKPGDPVAAFAQIAAEHPVFELVPKVSAH